MSQDSWQEIKSKMEGLGLKLKLHLNQENDETDDSAEPGATKAAMEELGQKLQDAFASFGAASKDPAVRSDLKDIGSLLKDTMAETFSNASSEVSDKFKKGDSQDDSTNDSPFDDPPADFAADDSGDDSNPTA